MTSDEELRRIGVEHGADGGIVIARISADMLDEYIDILALEPVQLAEHQAEIAAVAIATDGTKRAKVDKFLGNLYRAYVAGVPYLIAGLEIMEIFLVPIRVSVTDDADFLHGGINGNDGQSACG